MAFHVPEKFRVLGKAAGFLSEDNKKAVGTNNGLFEWGTLNGRIRVIASDGGGWEHVSVSFEKRTPSWGEMCSVKDLFWEADDCVVQYHPPKSEYVNYAPYCLHLWRPVGVSIPLPPTWMVGPRGTNE
jgi:hypothetical protein